MRKLVALALFALVASLGAVSGAAPAEAASSSATAVYRFWSDTKQGHFYTSSAAERDHVIQSYSTSVWKYEGAVYTAFASKESGTVPLYRFWSDLYQGHFYTTSEAEKAHVIAAYPDSVWKYEMVAYYVYPMGSSVAATLPVARFWSETKGHHFYTSDASEAAYVKANYPRRVWAYELDAFKVPSAAPAPAPVPYPIVPAGVVIDTSEESTVLSLVNSTRAARGAPALTISPALRNAAITQAAYQASISDMTHDGGGGLVARVNASGFCWSMVAENVAFGYRDGASVHNGWVNSEGHFNNIVNAGMTHMGLAKAIGPNGRPYWAQVFARAC